MLSIPYAAAGAGLANMYFWNVIAFGLCYITMMLLVQAAELYDTYTIENLLARCTWGLTGER